MKTVFVVNPKAGLGKSFKGVLDDIKKNNGEVYITKSKGDATEFVKNYIFENGEARFIACGGDGTYSEVLSGVMEAGCGEAGVMPVGSGNDFCRNFGEKDKFMSFNELINAPAVDCDVIKYVINYKDEKKTGYSANMINIGFDCAVADTTNTVREKTVFSGSAAYLVSIFINLIKKATSDFYIETDGKKRYDGEVLLTSVANGCFCGGGLKTNPIALTNDGFLNINIVKNISRLKFISVLPEYIKGSYIGKKKFEKIVTSEKVKTVKIIPKNTPIRISVDGEIMDAETLEFEIIHNAYKFANPYANVPSLEEIHI